RWPLTSTGFAILAAMSSTRLRPLSLAQIWILKKCSPPFSVDVFQSKPQQDAVRHLGLRARVEILLRCGKRLGPSPDHADIGPVLAVTAHAVRHRLQCFQNQFG